MADGYKNAGEYDFADLDEWLCEYVDGTIDPVVCKALEEYIQQNPELAMHVARLKEARHLLCQYGCSYQAPHGLQPRLRRRLATEIVEESKPLLGTAGVHLISLATITSVVAMILIFAVPTESTPTEPPGQTAQTETVQPQINLQFLPNTRTTPLRALSNNAYYSRFTPQPQHASFNRAFAPADVLPFNLQYHNSYPQTPVPQQADLLLATSP